MGTTTSNGATYSTALNEDEWILLWCVMIGWWQERVSPLQIPSKLKFHPMTYGYVITKTKTRQISTEKAFAIDSTSSRKIRFEWNNNHDTTGPTEQGERSSDKKPSRICTQRLTPQEHKQQTHREKRTNTPRWKTKQERNREIELRDRQQQPTKSEQLVLWGNTREQQVD